MGNHNVEWQNPGQILQPDRGKKLGKRVNEALQRFWLLYLLSLSLSLFLLGFIQVPVPVTVTKGSNSLLTESHVDPQKLKRVAEPGANPAAGSGQKVGQTISRSLSSL